MPLIVLRDLCSETPFFRHAVLSNLYSGIMRKLFVKQTRAPSSGSDASALVGQNVDDEEDILHIKHLPTFGQSML